jgi:tRNA-specific 2-thiouridylase
MKKVVVGMSGGVDSSVAALLLKEQGYDVIGLFMKNWEETDDQGQCLAAQEFEDVVRVCDLIGIPYATVNFTAAYWDSVFKIFLDELRLGHTPNPDILCNREIKFKVLFDKAKALGADFLATGHYAQTQSGQLLRSLDTAKDQTYFLYTLSASTLSEVLFPVGHLEKPALRALARSRGLPTAEKKDSTGICFIGKRDFKSFIQQYIAYHPGNFTTLSGAVVGQHDGVAYYTIGQRKGLGIGGPGSAWFVVGKDVARNVVFVEQGEDHPALYAPTLSATEAHWIAGTPPQFPLTCTAKIRYRQADQKCVVTPGEKEGEVRVVFEAPQRAITPRQSVVFYDGPVCLGGAMIS